MWNWYYSDTEHENLRKIVCDYITNHKEIYSEYFDEGEETLKQETKEMSKDGVWGTIVECTIMNTVCSLRAGGCGYSTTLWKKEKIVKL